MNIHWQGASGRNIARPSQDNTTSTCKELTCPIQKNRFISIFQYD
jgi:hypothetical protein